MLAVGLCALGEYELWSGGTYNGAGVWPGSHIINAVLVIPALTLPLLWRRRYPDLVCALVIGGLFLASLVLGGAESTTGFLVFIVVSYTAAAYARNPLPLLGGVALTAVVHELRDPQVQGPGDVVWMAGIVGIACLVGWAVRSRVVRIGALESAAEAAERQHAAQLVEVTRQQRATIARELHDVISHAVAVVVVQAQVGARALPDDVDQAAEAFAAIEQNGREAMGELRSLLTVLSEGEPIAGLTPTPSLTRLHELVVSFRQAGMSVDDEVPNPLPELDPSADLAGYRTVEEAMTNALRHAPGALVHLRVVVDGDSLRITISDSGLSSTAASNQRFPGTGRGLAAMGERLELAGGHLVQAGDSGSGFVVEAVLPVRSSIRVSESS